MRFSFAWRCGVVILLASLRTAPAEETRTATPALVGRPPLLDTAFTAFVEHQGRWAFTETHAGVGMDGRPSPETIFHVDPSLPYAQQFLPIKLHGKAPTEKQLKQWAERGERAAAHRQKEEVDGSSSGHRDNEVHLQINNQKVTPELDHAVATTEDETSVTYEVPLRKEGAGDKSLFDKFELTVRVNKQSQQFERATIRQRSSMRVQLIAKLTEGLIDIEFGSPDPRFPAVPVKVSSHITIKVLLGKSHVVSDDAVRTDFKHVTPYDERFGVKIGPMRTIEL